jgi:hypothetical protein
MGSPETHPRKVPVERRSMIFDTLNLIVAPLADTVTVRNQDKFHSLRPIYLVVHTILIIYAAAAHY